jgi:hypothetical protein
MMKGKKLLQFLLYRPLLNGKNFSSLGLVALFFLAYTLFGGQGVTIPKMGPGGEVTTPAALSRGELPFNGMEKPAIASQNTQPQTPTPSLAPAPITVGAPVPADARARKNREELDRQIERLNALKERPNKPRSEATPSEDAIREQE